MLLGTTGTVSLQISHIKSVWLHKAVRACGSAEKQFVAYDFYILHSETNVTD